MAHGALGTVSERKHGGFFYMLFTLKLIPFLCWRTFLAAQRTWQRCTIPARSAVLKREVLYRVLKNTSSSRKKMNRREIQPLGCGTGAKELPR